MATVYLADDVTGERQVAIKVLKPEMAGSIGAERFLREIAVTQRLHHPNIVPLLESGRSGDALFFVMSYVDGETLRAKLAREKQLPIDQAVGIARDVCGALSAAHAQGIVHRDIKPENILLDGERGLVADFGIARALSFAAEEKLTESGVGIGTPGYMSPEQAGGESELDGRTDIYALGCVLYEMLTGEAPYTGPSAQAIFAKQLSLPVPSVRVVRNTVSTALDAVVRRALAKVAADRFATAADLHAALAAAERATDEAPVVGNRQARRRKTWLLSGLGVSIAALGWLLLNTTNDGARAGETLGDTTTYVVLPLMREGTDTTTSRDDTDRLRDALARWAGLTVVDPSRVREAVGTRGSSLPSVRDAAQLSRDLGAGMFLVGSVSTVNDSLRIRVALRNANTQGALLAERAIRLPSSGAGDDSLFASLVDGLLFRGTLPPTEIAPPPRRSLPARQAFAAGRRALASWNLRQADSLFYLATTFDTDYAQAHLWLALVRAWNGMEPARWRVEAHQASLGAQRLTARERDLAAAAVFQSEEDLGRACPIWRRLTNSDSLDALAWYGSAYCQRADAVVLADGRSPSGWRFRSSYHQSLIEYRRAFQLLPPILASLRGQFFEPLRVLFKISGSNARRGRAHPPDSSVFVAEPIWDGDSLAFVPYLMREAVAHTTRQPVAISEAVRRQRILVRSVASSWVAAFPENADAWEALAIAIAMLGDRSALDTLAVARDRARGPPERLRVAGSAVWMQLAFAIPAGDLARLRQARALADSLLRDRRERETSDPLLMAGLSALTGRAIDAANYLRSPRAANAFGAPALLQESTGPLLAYAALGGPVDSLVALERRMAALIEGSVRAAERPTWRLRFLARAATMAFPSHRFSGLASFAKQGDWLIDIQDAFTRGDSAAVRLTLNRIRRDRGSLAPETITFDGLYPEAELLMAMRDARGAAAWLDPTLMVLPHVAPQVLASPLQAASLVRAMALRSRAALALGDRTEAAAWARAVVILWSDADVFLQPVVAEMRRLAQ